ncbi:hypothetical protein [Symbioplanes lichenis]|uniref:hypothetical protein n=1 Tax=Symbioplanes lichenis TaxID=1629072 RepID=UPI00273A4048|nr:hypothetical protein [Actinoplanes lichenis]
MPLITRGSLDRFTASATDPAVREQGLDGAHAFSVFREVTRRLQPVRLELARSAGVRSLRLSGLELRPESRVMLRGVADADRPVHLVGWWWDLAGGGPTVVPAPGEAKDWALRLDGDGVRRLSHPVRLADPGRAVTGGLTVRLIPWQAEPGTDPEALVAEVAEAMRHTTLAGALDMLGEASRVTMSTVIAVRQAASALGPEIAPVLRALCRDYIDLFEGFYPAAEPDTAMERHEGYQSVVTLRVSAE